MIKIKNIRLGLIGLLIFLAALIIPTSKSAIANGAENIVYKNFNEYIYEVFGNRTITNIEYLYNFDDSPDYIYVECENGYAIYLRDTLNLLEYSLDEGLPYYANDKKRYYGGPGNYYFKEKDLFINCISDVLTEMTEVDAKQSAQSVLDLFSAKSCKGKTEIFDATEYSDIIIEPSNQYSHSPKNDLDLEDATAPGTNKTKYISNYDYFQLAYFGNNKTGTCSAVAIQLLLGYHNYYNDRRLISDKHLYGWDKDSQSVKYPELNPNYCTNPIQKNASILSASGYNEKDEGSYFKYIIDQINPPCSIKEEVAGIKKIINNRNNEISSTIEYEIKSDSVPYDSNKYIDENIIKNEIDQGNPLMLGIRCADNEAHSIIAYGYENKNNQMGYITHYGYQDRTINQETKEVKSFKRIWANATWCYDYLTFKLLHTHDYNKISTEYKCKTCGHRTVDAMAFQVGGRVEQDGVRILGLNFPVIGEVEIPEYLNEQKVVEIKDEAFKNQNKLTILTMPATIKKIGNSAFENCSNLYGCIIQDNSQLTEIGDFAFKGCDLMRFYLPDTVTKIGKNAFELCDTMREFEISKNSKLTEIGEGAFLNCSKLEYLYFPASIKNIPIDLCSNCTSLTFVEIGPNNSIGYVGNNAFQGCSSLISLSMINTRIYGSSAFAGCVSLKDFKVNEQSAILLSNMFYNCPNLVIYTSQTSLVQSWKNFNCPVVLNCTFSDDWSYVVSFTKTDTNPYNLDGENAGLVPYRNDYVLSGWYANPDKTGGVYTRINEAPNCELYASWLTKSEAACVADGTMITLADGRQKAVEDLTGDEMLLVWNLRTGAFDVAPILFIDSEIRAEYEVIRLSFADGTQVKVIDEHAFWDVGLNKYVYLRNDAAKYIGHSFNKQTVDENGNLVWKSVELVDVEVYKEVTTAWSPVTYGHLCYYVNGMLSMPGAIEGLINIFDVDEQTMSYDEAAFEADIEQYGLFTYEEFAALVPVSQEVFEAFNGQYLKVAIGKGLVTVDELNALAERYAKFFN